MYLLDTNVISLIAPTRRRAPADEELAEWIESRSDDLWLSVVTAAEIEDGIAKAARLGAARKDEDFGDHRSWVPFLTASYCKTPRESMRTTRSGDCQRGSASNGFRNFTPSGLKSLVF